MKILWCDDRSQDEVEFQKFLDDWDLRNRRTDVLRASDDQTALAYLKTETEIGLLILDLLWEDEPEHETVTPTGIRILERIRALHPDLWIVTRSKIEDPALLSRLVQSFVKFGVSDHFRSPDKTPMAMLRKHVIVEMVDQNPTPANKGTTPRSLKSFLGDHWGVVLFADISGFTTVTEALWRQNRVALCSALEEFYRRAAQVVTNHQGVVDKFIGDELMAIFFERDGEGKTEVATRAIDCALILLSNFRELEYMFKKAMTQEDEAVLGIEWKLKIGMEAGALRIMEQTLPDGEAEYCAVGRAINFASRVKGKAGPYSITFGHNLRIKLTNDELYSCELIVTDSQLKGIQPEAQMYKLSSC